MIMTTQNKLAIKSLFSTIRKMKLHFAYRIKSKLIVDFKYATFLADIRATINQLRTEQNKPLWFKTIKNNDLVIVSDTISLDEISNEKTEHIPYSNGKPFLKPIKIVVNPSTTLNDDLADTKNRTILESHKNSLGCDNPKVKYRRFKDKGFNDDLNPYGKLLADNVTSYYDIPKVDPMKKQKEEKRIESKPVYYRVNRLLAKIESRFKPIKLKHKRFTKKNAEIESNNKKLAKIRWELFSNLFSKYPINPEYLEDSRVLFIFRYISKIRQGIKVKFDGNKTIIRKAKTIIGNRVDKSKGYKSNHWTKDHDLTRITIQEAFLWCLNNGKKLTPKILIYTANKQMSEQKKTQRKLDKIMWNNR